MRKIHIISAFLVLATLAGCQRTTYSGFSSAPAVPQQPTALQPVPVGGVNASTLPDVVDSNSNSDLNSFPAAPTSSENLTIASASTSEVSKEEMIGRWTIGSGGENCDIFLSLTKWTGGYRAASRGCIGNIATVSAWDVEGKQVVLADNNGARIGRLYKTGHEKFDGASTSGQAITLGR